MKRLIIISYLCIAINLAIGQSSNLFMPPQFQVAYEKGTRSWDGRPGNAYWQNTARYKIRAEYDPVTKVISGTEEIIYVNNSPDSIRYLVTKLYQNAYKKGSARDMGIDEDLLTDGVEIIRFTVRGKTFYKDNQPFLQEISPLLH